MVSKFSIPIEKQFYSQNAFVTKIISNVFGNWHTIIVRQQSSLKCLIIFVPTQRILGNALGNLKIVGICFSFNLVVNCDSPNENISKVTAAQLPRLISVPATKRKNSTEFELVLNKIPLDHCQFQINFEVDATSLERKCSDLPSPSLGLQEFTKEMFQTKKLGDIKILTPGGKEIKASRFILARSKVFDAMLNTHNTKEAQEGIIRVTDIEHEVMNELIRYMYTDEVRKLNSMALGLMIAANKYNLSKLVDRCVIYLKQNVTLENFAVILINSDALGIEDLKNVALEFFIKNHENIFELAEWKSLKQNYVQLGMEIMERCFLSMNKKFNNTTAQSMPYIPPASTPIQTRLDYDDLYDLDPY